jgi:hypothetical protein
VRFGGFAGFETPANSQTCLSDSGGALNRVVEGKNTMARLADYTRSIEQHNHSRSIARAFTAVALGWLQKQPADAIAAYYWPLDDAAALITKAASAPAATSGSWGGQLAPTVVANFLSGLAPGSAAVKLFAKSMNLNFEGVHQINVTRASTAALPVFVAEGGPAPTAQDVFSSVTTGPIKKLLMLVPFTNDLESYAIETATSILGRVASEAGGRALDTAVFGAGAAGAAPAGLLNGLSTLGATAGGGLAALAGDISKIADNAATGFCDPDDLMFFAAPPEAVKLRLLASPSFTYPIISVPTLADGVIVGIVPSGIASGSDGLPQIDVSKQATIHFEDTTPLQLTTGPQGTAVVATPTRSLWQSNSSALRLRLKTTWASLQPGAVGFISSVTW